MGNLWEKAKAHPTITAFIVFGVGLLFVILLFGGNKSGGTTVVAPVAQNTDSSAATALQMANLNASVQTNATNAALQAALAGVAANVTDSNNNASVQLANIYAGADTTKYVADLGAKVALDTNSTAKAINDSNMSAAQQIATIQSMTDIHLADVTATISAGNNDVAKYGIDAGKVVSLASIDAGKVVSLASLANENQKNQQNYTAELNRQSLNYQYLRNITETSSAVVQATGQQLQVGMGRI